MKARNIRRWAAVASAAALATVGIAASGQAAHAQAPINLGGGSWVIITGDPVALHNTVSSDPGCQDPSSASDPAVLSGTLTVTFIGVADDQDAYIYIGNNNGHGWGADAAPTNAGDDYVQYTVDLGGNTFAGGPGFACDSADGNFLDYYGQIIGQSGTFFSGQIQLSNVD